MKFTNKWNGHGGDVQFYSIDSLPQGASKIDDQPVAFGEKSGHIHIFTGDVELFEGQHPETGELMKFAVVGSDGAFHQHMKDTTVSKETYRINKHLSNADHIKPCPLIEGVYAIGIHQRYNPYEKVFQKVVD